MKKNEAKFTASEVSKIYFLSELVYWLLVEMIEK